MTQTPPEDDLPEDDAIAAEYVLGTLDLAERSAAEARLRRDQGFAARVEDWQNRLADLNDDYAEEPAPNLMPQIEARLFPQAKAARKRWFGGLAGFGLLAASLAVAAFVLLTPPGPSLTATLAADSSPLRYAAAVTGDALTVTQVAGSDAEAGKDYELWIIIGDNAPQSLGLLRDGQTTFALPDAAAGYVLAVTLEPLGGAPDGKPTMPILAAGPLQSG